MRTLIWVLGAKMLGISGHRWYVAVLQDFMDPYEVLTDANSTLPLRYLRT